MNIAASAAPARLIEPSEPIRVIVVDDAVVVRGLLARWIDNEPDMQVVATLRGGREAIDQLERTMPDVVILDIAMPDIDGIATLPRLLEKKRDLVVLMASTLTRRNAEISLQALALGAADYIAKPGNGREVTTSGAFRRELIEKIRVLGGRNKRRFAGQARGKNNVVAPAAEQIRLRPFATAVPRVLLIGSSTGGPQALDAILGGIGAVIDSAPVLIAQHMPPTFTAILAQHLGRVSGRPAEEAKHGEVVRAGRIYVAPGGFHMHVAREDGNPVIALGDDPPEHFCKPAVDPLFASAASVWGCRNLAVVLTGMGTDGARGAAHVAAAGGSVIAQDEESSVVWGMPGSVARAGLASAVLPLDQIGGKLTNLFARGQT